jgi:flagellar basal-body rod protein FlgB
MIDPIGDTTMRALSQALTGLSLRQRTIADNIANIDTPRFLAGKVDFETSLLQVLGDGGDPTAAVVSTPRSLEPTGENGNNVNLDEETLAGAQTGLTYQLGVQAMTDHFQRLRIAAGGNA